MTSYASIPRTGILSSWRALLRLASKIGEGGKIFHALGELERIFHPTKSGSAQAADERRFIMARPSSLSGAAAAYWASLGLPRAWRISELPRAHSTDDVGGAAELESALRALGVRVMKRPAELTVTLVHDYLEDRLAELNREHLSARTPWLLVQPSGIFPLVGPVLLPGKSACWLCLAERMTRNREVKALLHRASARRIAARRSRTTRSEEGDRVCGDRDRKGDRYRFRTDFDHIISLDLLGSASRGTTSRRGRNAHPAAAGSRATRRAPAPYRHAGGSR
jgi:ribosomal protein S12 methylthiotransferase accessory factor